MRPRKTVLLYCADRERRHDLTFVLRVRCQWARIEPFAEMAGLLDALEEGRTVDACRCIVLVGAEKGDHTPDGQLHGEDAERRQRVDFEYLLRQPGRSERTVEVIRLEAYPAHNSLASRVVLSGEIAALIEAMKLAASRKPGPKAQKKAAA